MKEVPATRHEQRDLIMLRNELAYYLTRTLPRPDPMDVLVRNLETLELPDPINSGRICEKCPYNVICCTYLKKDKKIKLSDNHPLNVISPAVLGHLKSEHIDYFIHWTGLLSMEEEEGKKGKQVIGNLKNKSSLTSCSQTIF
jgi:DNA replication ATP-dependent helicase Dna2